MAVEYSEHLPDGLGVSREGFEDEARMAMAVEFFEMGRISSGVAAVMAGCGRARFLMDLHRWGVPVVDLEEGELREVSRYGQSWAILWIALNRI